MLCLIRFQISSLEGARLFSKIHSILTLHVVIGLLRYRIGISRVASIYLDPTYRASDDVSASIRSQMTDLVGKVRHQNTL